MVNHEARGDQAVAKPSKVHHHDIVHILHLTIDDQGDRRSKVLNVAHFVGVWAVAALNEDEERQIW